MSVEAIVQLLLASEAIAARVSADSIVAGDVPVDAPLPALGIKEIGSVPVGAFDAQAEHSVAAARVQVMAMSKAYPEVKELLALVRRACNFQRGQLAGVDVISIVRDTVGPDLRDAADTHFQSIDFKVTYHEPN